MPVLTEDYCTTSRREHGLCKCFAACKLASDTDNQRSAYGVVGIIYGAWFVITVTILLCYVEERGKERKLPPSPPIVAGSLKTFLNKPFKLLLPSWVLENVAAAIFGARPS